MKGDGGGHERREDLVLRLGHEDGHVRWDAALRLGRHGDRRGPWLKE